MRRFYRDGGYFALLRKWVTLCTFHEPRLLARSLRDLAATRLGRALLHAWLR